MENVFTIFITIFILVFITGISCTIISFFEKDTTTYSLKKPPKEYQDQEEYEQQLEPEPEFNFDDDDQDDCGIVIIEDD